MGSITEFTRKSGITPVVVVLGAFIVVDLGVVLPAVLKEMQTKTKAEGLDFFDVALLIIVILSCIGKTVAAFMNKSFARWADQRDEQHAEDRKLDTELRLKAADGAVPPKPPLTQEQEATIAEGHLRR